MRWRAARLSRKRSRRRGWPTWKRAVGSRGPDTEKLAKYDELFQVASKLVLDWHEVTGLGSEASHNVVSTVFSHPQWAALAALVAVELANYRGRRAQTERQALVDAEEFADRLAILASGLRRTY